MIDAPSRYPIWLETRGAIEALQRGDPLGPIIDRLTTILERAVVESYRGGMSFKECGEAHGITRSRAITILHNCAPQSIRPKGGAHGKGGRRKLSREPKP